MAYRKKADLLFSQKPDIVIVPECEHPDKFKPGSKASLHSDALWVGKNRNKGLGVFSYSAYRFQIHESYNDSFRNIVPIILKGGAVDFTLLAIWANNPEDKGFVYVGQIWKALQHYDHLLNDKNVIIAGDFNSNTIWDKPRREGNHSTVVKLLESRGIFSTYHRFYKQEQGKEKHNTLFMYRHPDKAYHIDYCFVSGELIKKLVSVKVGTHKKWKTWSDHTPLSVRFDL